MGLSSAATGLLKSTCNGKGERLKYQQVGGKVVSEVVRQRDPNFVQISIYL